MPILAVLVILIQVGFAVHAIRNGRELYWVAIIVMFPLIGCLVYFFVGVYPTLGVEKRAKKAASGIAKLVDPDRDMRARIDDVEQCGSVDNKLALAQECENRGHLDDAAKLYKSVLSGAFVNDPKIQYAYANVCFAKGDFATAKHTLSRLVETLPKAEGGNAALLLARTHEALGERNDALRLYEPLAFSYAGEEARYRYASLLNQVGRQAEARKVLEEILANARRQERWYSRQHASWIDAAKRDLG
jgi:hypothetical protein